MKKVLVVGNTCCDVIVRLPRLPQTGEDINPYGQSIRVGGCPFNAANIVRQAGVEVTFVTPVGTGTYGDFVKAELLSRGFSNFVPVPGENGCCYCLVEDGGERTFLSVHGVEYTFQEAWMEKIHASAYGIGYFCGIDAAEQDGEHLIDWFAESGIPEIVFAPGPQLMEISKKRIKKILSLHPVLHLNEEEAKRFSGCNHVKDAASAIHEMSHNTVIITMGARGAAVLENDELLFCPAVETQVKDTIGAGDSHVGQMMAARARGYSWETAMRQAAVVSSAVVATEGASLTDECYQRLALS